MRKTLFCLVVLFVATILCRGQDVQPSSDCMEETHPQNLCRWSASAGSVGRVCHLDVERIDQKEACHFEATYLEEPDDHPPICISAGKQEHIAFESSKKRPFRVRRLVRINEKNENGQVCPEHPFRRHFNASELNFQGNKDTDVVDSAPDGCMYKFEVQFRDLDRNGPEEQFDQKRTRFECRDPHIKIVNKPLPQ
jgi:hypothetical protein